MSQTITNPALRIKITGICNRTCSFCNEEGDMRTIEGVEPNESFFECIHTLMEMLGIRQIMLTGGEPTIHPDLFEIINGINAPEILLTTNGIRPLSISDWALLRSAGLHKVILSIHDVTPQSLLQSETCQRKFSWAVSALESQKRNIVTASEASLNVRINTVAYRSREQINQVLHVLENLQQKYRFDIRILNDIANIESSQQIITNICQVLGAKIIMEERRAGSSNRSVLWKTESGFRFSTKTAYPYFFSPICDGCQNKEYCHEGFYGVRIERRMSSYWVRLCIYKHSQDVLMPWRSFVESDLAKELKDICATEQS